MYCVGIDCGFSHMTIAVVDSAENVVGSNKAREPAGDGHDKQVALARLRNALEQLREFRDQPVFIAGYCYKDSGVREAFLDAGWTVPESMAFNDAVGVYGLTEMPGHTLVCGCGSFSQIVYIDGGNNVCWPSDNLMKELPQWPLCGDKYSAFMLDAYGASSRERFLSETIDSPPTQSYLRRAAEAVRETCDVFWRHSLCDVPPAVVLGGGAVGDDQLWDRLSVAFEASEVKAERVVGLQAEGLARFAMSQRQANVWSHVGDRPPSWLQ